MGRKSGQSDVDVEAEIDVAGSRASTNPPVRGRDIAYDDRDVIFGDAKRLEALDDLPIQGALGLKRAPREGVDANLRIAIGLSHAGRAGKTVRLVRQESDMPVVWRDSERPLQRAVNGVHEGELLVLGVLSAHLDQHVWHCRSGYLSGSELSLLVAHQHGARRSGNKRRHPNGDEQPWRFGTELGHVAGWWLRWEPLRVHLVHAVEIGRIDQQHAHLDDVVQAGTAGTENGLAVGQRLSCLSLDRLAGEAAAPRIDADDSREDQVGSGLDSLAEERRAGRILGCDNSTRHLGPPEFSGSDPSGRIALQVPKRPADTSPVEILEFHRIRAFWLPICRRGASLLIAPQTYCAGALALLTVCAFGVGDAVAATTSVYVANSGDQTISQFSRRNDGQLSALSPASVALADEPVALVSTPDGHHLYVATRSESGSGSLEELAISADGSLQPFTPSAVALSGFPTSLTTSPDGRHVYVTEFVEGTGTVAQFLVGADGALSPLTPASVPVEAATEIAISPDGRHAYVVDGEASGYVWQFEVASDGTLHALTPSSIQVGFKPHGIAISPDGHSVYVVDGHKALDQFGVTEDGTLQALTPPSVSAVDYPVSIGLSPAGGELIATEVPGEEATGVVQSFERRPDGTLSAEVSKTAPSGDLPWGLAISPDGQNAYVTSRLSSGSEGLWQLGFAPSYELEALTPAFANTGSEPASIAIATQQPSTSSRGSSSVASPTAGSSPTAPSAVGTAPPAPTANAVASRGRRKRRGEIFTFDGTLSVDPGGKIVAYRWMLHGRVISTASRFHRFFSSAHRAYSLTLTVVNSEGVSASTVITVAPRSKRAPVVNVTIPATANFCIDCAQPSPATARILRRLRRYVRGARLVSISSYADDIGTRAYNLELTRRRSQAIARLLLTGVFSAPRHVHLSWYGESDPVASNATSAGRARNRRSVIRIVR